jgi:1,4-alpha-glucan branching enzyme
MPDPVMEVIAPSTRPGMGSTPFDGGVTFRVWAPNATAVAVSLAQRGGEPTVVSLAQESGGIWSADVGSVCVDQQYTYLLPFPTAS